VICADTTVLIDEFRAKGSASAPVNRALLAHGAEILILPAVVAGEFLDGARMVSEPRYQESLALLRRRNVVTVDLETAQHYGEIVSHLRQQGLLAGKSQNDLWIAASARRHGARVLTRNAADFSGVPGLSVLTY
jgi:tRNA(fMet)-specific endonuclease VapC